MGRFSVMLFLSWGFVTTVSALPPTPAPQVELFLAGATAQDEALENLMRLTSGSGAPNICEPGSLDIYRGRIDGTAKRVFYCRTSAAIAGVPAGTRLAVHKSSGGSGEGVTPVADGTPVAFIDLTKLPSTPGCATGEAIPSSGDFAAHRNHTGCDGAARAVVPRAGMSDVEPELVSGSSQGLQVLTVRAQNQIVWGLPVSKNLRNALQGIQGLIKTTVPHDDPSRETEEAMPSLTRPQISGIFSGRISSWDQFTDSAGTPLSRSNLLAPGPPANADMAGSSPGAYRPSALQGSTVYICRRIGSSGTQAAFEVHYLHARCSADAPKFTSPNDGSDINTGGDVARLVRIGKPAGSVFAGVGSGDVRDCLDAHEQFNRWAVGVLSTESIGNNGGREFRYIKIDGSAPTLRNTYLGRWSHMTEQSMQWRKSFDASMAATGEGRVLRFVAVNLGSPRVIAALNTGFVHPWGQGGYLAPPSNGFPIPQPVTTESLRTNPVGGITRSLGRLSNCNEPVVWNSSVL